MLFGLLLFERVMVYLGLRHCFACGVVDRIRIGT